VRQDLLCLGQERHPRGCQRDVMGAALKQPDTQLTLQSLHLLAQRGLHDVLPRRGAAEVPFFGQDNKITKLAQLHAYHPPAAVPTQRFSGGNAGDAPAAWLRTLAHVGWMFRDDPTPATHYVPDLLADPAMTRVARAFPALCAVSLILPFAAGWALGGDLRAALAAFLWAGLVRVLVLHHVTWSVNSLCHMFGSRPHPGRRFDRSTDLWPLALISLGESWHNGHHAAPACARHGSCPHQIDPSAGLIRILERLGWVTGVHWPDSQHAGGGQPALLVRLGRR
jgi:stearoyl-CoA desaturase (Delta-9 desaturase)